MRISALIRRAQEDNPQQVKTLLSNVNYLWKELGNTLSPTSSRSITPKEPLFYSSDPKVKEAEKLLAELQKKLKDTYHAAYEAMKQLSQLKA